MIQNFKRNCFAWLGAASLIAGGAANSQAQIVWGAGTGIAAQETQATFAATDTTFAGTNWVTSNNTDGLWKWSSNGRSRGSNSIAAVSGGGAAWITSPTIANGAAIFDSDYFYTQTGAAPQAGSLTLGNIDLTGYADSLLSIRFYTSYLDWNTDTALVEFSIDGGTTWTTADVYPLGGGGGQDVAYNGWINFNVAGALVGATNLTNCQIRFRFNGDSYFWAVDDISIVKASAYDVAIATPTGGSTLGSAFTVARVSGNYYQPLSQVSEDEYFFAARIVNRGALDLPGAKLFAKVERNAGGSWALEAFDSIAVSSVLSANAATSVDTFGTFSNNWLPTQAGEYRVTYFVKQTTGADASTANDTVTHLFNVVDSVAPYYSKVPLASDLYPAADNIVFPGSSAGSQVTEFEYGNMFFFPQGSLMQLDSVRFRLYRYSSSFSPATFTGSVVTVRVAKFTDLNGDGKLSDDPSLNELSLVGIGTDTISTTTANASSFVKGAALIEDISGTGALQLNDTSIYLVSIEQTNPNGLTSGSGSTARVNAYAVATYSLNYAMNAGFMSSIAPSPVRVAEAGTTTSNEWNWVGFGADREPSIGLFLTDLRTIAVRELANNVSSLEVYPNPSNSIVNVKVALNEMANINYVMTDVSGRVVRMSTSKNVQAETATFDVSNLASGVYFITVRTNKGVSTQRFVKE